MGHILIISEKPSQAKAYVQAFQNVKRHKGYFEIPSCSIFPKGALLTWCIGHLVTLKEPHEYKEEWKKWNFEDLPIVPDSFAFKPSPHTKEQFDVVESLMKDADEIIVATDCDREGENIARSLINLVGCSHIPTKRLWINSLVEDEVRKGFQNLKNGDDFIPSFESAQARQIGDWLVGLNSSRLYSLLLAQKGIKADGVFSVGRVQTPTLYLIYKRQKAILDFKSETFFELFSTFHVGEEIYKGKARKKFSSINEVELFLQKYNLALSSKTPGKILNVTKQTKKEIAPKLHSLSSLQSIANKKYKYSPDKVLKTLQSLYDSPLTLLTYPRTDTQYITENEFEYLKNNLTDYQRVVKQMFEPYSLEANSKYVDGKKVQEHYAIIPTEKIPTEQVLNSLNEEQKNIYFEVVNSMLAMFHTPYIYEETTIDTSVNGLLFNTKGKVIKSEGWKSLYPKTALPEKKSKNDEVAFLPEVEQGMDCIAELMRKEGKTKAPERYTEGQLINLMKTAGTKSDEDIDSEDQAILKEVEGLGTEATRSSIIETLKRLNYIEVKKNLVYVTSKGEILCEVVEGTMLSKPELTAKWEGYLKKIALKEGDKTTFINSTIAFIKKVVNDSKSTVQNINIDSKLTEMSSEEHISLCPSCKKGHIIDKKTFYGCTDYKNGCKLSFQKKILDKNLTKTVISQLCKKGKTTKKIKFKGKKEFEAFLILKENKLEFSFK